MSTKRQWNGDSNDSSVFVFKIKLCQLTIEAYSIEYIMQIFNIFLILHSKVLSKSVKCIDSYELSILSFLAFKNLNFNLHCIVIQSYGYSLVVFDLHSFFLARDWLIIIS